MLNPGGGSAIGPRADEPRGSERPYVRAASRFGAALALAFGLAFAAAAGRHDGDPLAVFAAQPPPAVRPANPAEPPVGVAARVSGRRITVSWDAVSGAGGYAYVVAVRAADGIVPFAWTEYDAVSPPYTVADTWAMSGLSYEVRVAAIAGGGRPAWSPAVTVTAPVLQPAPAGAVRQPPPRPRAVGEDVSVALSHRGFTNRSPWRWSVCAADGSDCRLLPRRSPTWHYVIGAEAYGKRLRVQVDYDQGGVSRSASAALGVVGLPAPLPPPSVAHASRACPRRPAAGQRTGTAAPPDAATVETHLHALTVEQPVRFRGDYDAGARGGAVDVLCDDLLVVTAWGRMVLVSGREARFLDGRVPMLSPELAASGVPELEQRHLDFNPGNFRVADVLLRPRAAGRWRLFVTHHYADAECIGFRLSSTAVRREGERVVVSPAWTTVLDFEPCTNYADGHQAGGRMLPDGPRHLLAVVGDHASEHLPQAPDSNLGKLLRIDTGTGRAEVLAVGLRNPQGFARDAEGVLWETEHGPRGGDELNVLEAGGNYGWPRVSHGVRYVLRSVGGRAGWHDGFASPVFFWTPSIGISSVMVNDERFFPLWGNDLLVASLRGGALLRIRRDGTDVKSVEEIYSGPAIRDMAQMLDGRIALFNGGGSVRFLSRSAVWCRGGRFRRWHVYSKQCPPADRIVSPPR